MRTFPKPPVKVMRMATSGILDSMPIETIAAVTIGTHTGMAMEFPTDEIGHEVTKALFKRHVMVAGTLVNAKTVRIEPPLTQADETIDKVLAALDEALAEVKEMYGL